MINIEISKADKINIYMRTAVKALRGMMRRVFLKQVQGLFLVGKHVQITHGKHIE